MKHIDPQTKRILILGSAGTGKTTFAHELGEKLALPVYSTDNFLWKKKYTKMYTRASAAGRLHKQVYTKRKWVVEGTSRELIKEGIEKSDIILNFRRPGLLKQYYYVIKRNYTTHPAQRKEFLNFLKYIFLSYIARFKIGPYRNTVSREEMIQPHSQKVLVVKNFRHKHKLLRQLSDE